MKRLLITGGCGFIGVGLIRLMKARGGWSVTVMDNESVGPRERVAELGVQFIHGDVTDRQVLIKALMGQDAVVHLAAHTRVVESVENPRVNFDSNVSGTFNVLECALGAKVERIINASTGGAILGEAPPPVDETMVARPTSPYGASKLAAEGYCSAYEGSFGLSTISLRFSNVYGPQSYHKGSAVAAFYRQILAGDAITVYGDGEQSRDFVHVDDIASGIAAAIDSEVTGVVQLGTGVPTTINELLDKMRQVVGPKWSFDVEYCAPRAGEIRSTWCNISHARDALGFLPKTGLDEGLEQTWAWFREAQSNL